MLKKSHRSLSFSLSPFLFIEYPHYKWNTFLSEIGSERGMFYTIIFFIFYWIGSTLPDIDLKFKYLMPKQFRNQRFRYHRQLTHSLLLSFGSLYLLYLYPQKEYILIPLYGVIFGIITHQIGDMLTGTVPIFFVGPYYMRFSRLGINTFLPRIWFEIFTVKFPKWLNKNLWIFFIVFILSILSIWYFKIPLILS